jgi:hypothetical protein
MKRLSVVGLAVALALAWTCGGCGKKKEKEEPQTRSISVLGLSEIKLAPDMLTVSIGVDTLDKDPLKSQAENDKAVKTILALAKQLGIAPEDVETGCVSLRQKETPDARGVPFLEGYAASTTVTIVLRDLTKYNLLVTGSLKAGANRVGNLSFGCSREQEKRREARLAAITAAKQKAEDLAGQLGQKLGKPTSIEERAEALPVQANTLAYLSEDSPDQGTTIAAGRMVIRCGVAVTFELKD